MIDIRGIDANDNNTLRGNLAQNQMRATVVKNTLVRKAWADTPFQSLCELLDGPCAVVTGGESTVDIARLPQAIRGFGPVKMRSIEAAERERTALQSTLRSPETPASAAE